MRPPGEPSGYRGACVAVVRKAVLAHRTRLLRIDVILGRVVGVKKGSKLSLADVGIQERRLSTGGEFQGRKEVAFGGAVQP